MGNLCWCQDFLKWKIRFAFFFFYTPFKMICNCTCFYICMVNISHSDNEKAFTQNFGDFLKNWQYWHVKKITFEWNNEVKSYIKKNFNSIPRTIKEQNWYLFQKKNYNNFKFERKLSKKMWVFHKKMLTSAKCSTFLNFFFKKVLIEEYIHAKFQFCSTFCSKVIQIQKVIQSYSYQLFNVHKKAQLGKR